MNTYTVFYTKGDDKVIRKIAVQTDTAQSAVNIVRNHYQDLGTVAHVTNVTQVITCTDWE